MGSPIRNLTRVIRSVFDGTNKALVETANAVKDGMSVPGDPVEYPVPWDSVIQQRAFFASGGFGEGIPHTRRDLYIHSWAVKATVHGATLTAPSPAGAIGGMPSGWQSSVTRGRWPFLLDVLFRELAKLPSRISNNISVYEGNQPK